MMGFRQQAAQGGAGDLFPRPDHWPDNQGLHEDRRRDGGAAGGGHWPDNGTARRDSQPAAGTATRRRREVTSMPEPTLHPSQRDPAEVAPADSYRPDDPVWVYRHGVWRP